MLPLFFSRADEEHQTSSSPFYLPLFPSSLFLPYTSQSGRWLQESTHITATHRERSFAVHNHQQHHHASERNKHTIRKASTHFLLAIWAAVARWGLSSGVLDMANAFSSSLDP